MNGGEIIMWVMWLSRYLLCGVLVTIFFDWFIKQVSDKEFTNGERVAVIIFWPIGILSFIWGFIRGEKDE